MSYVVGGALGGVSRGKVSVAYRRWGINFRDEVTTFLFRSKKTYSSLCHEPDSHSGGAVLAI